MYFNASQTAVSEFSRSLITTYNLGKIEKQKHKKKMKNMDSTFAVAFFSMAPVVRLNVCWSCSVLSLFAIDNI